MHINVPSKFGMCRFNNIEMATYVEPSLLNVSVNRYKMGKQAMELIFARLNNLEISDNAQINTEQRYVIPI
jgi:LacI family gluconate utilization system Gnt-I transcriptional repressor